MDGKMKPIKRYNNVFSSNVVKKIHEDMADKGWQFGHGSYPSGDKRRGYPFWMKDLSDDSFYTEHLLNMIQELTQREYKLYDVYANGHTFGTQGNFHVDWYDSSERTFLYYANERWMPEWGGKTIFNLNNQYEYYDPYPNTAICFPGEISHMAEGVSRLFTGLRVTIAWKLLLK